MPFVSTEPYNGMSLIIELDRFFSNRVVSSSVRSISNDPLPFTTDPLKVVVGAVAWLADDIDVRDREERDENESVELGGDRGGRGTRVGSILGVRCSTFDAGPIEVGARYGDDGVRAVAKRCALATGEAVVIG